MERATGARQQNFGGVPRKSLGLSGRFGTGISVSTKTACPSWAGLIEKIKDECFVKKNLLFNR
jgi:hypothetical protein